jgi:hypothetical protein
MFFNTYPFGIMQHSENKRKTDTYVLKNEWPSKLMIDRSEEKASPKIPKNLRAKGETHTETHTFTKSE